MGKKRKQKPSDVRERLEKAGLSGMPLGPYKKILVAFTEALDLTPVEIRTLELLLGWFYYRDRIGKPVLFDGHDKE